MEYFGAVKLNVSLLDGGDLSFFENHVKIMLFVFLEFNFTFNLHL